MTPRPGVTIHIGKIHVAKEPTVIKTVVGSCIAVCLFDPVLRLGGMNHFLLPTPCNGDTPADPARFGIHAMELLIGAMQKSGGDRRRLQAKVFGGGHVLAFSAQTDSVPAQNIRFIQQFLATERVPVLGWDLGGYLPRRVHFYTDTGAAYVKRTEAAYAEQVRDRVERQFRRRAKELGYEVRKVEPPVPAEVSAG